MPTNKQWGQMMIENEQEWETIVADLERKHQETVRELCEQIRALQKVIVSGSE
jgi:hypothetical protein|tara:strand:- start:1136 stop:1294 length:159 start_codon:yes stop_codon:yes gene_type:complete